MEKYDLFEDLDPYNTEKQDAVKPPFHLQGSSPEKTWNDCWENFEWNCKNSSAKPLKDKKACMRGLECILYEILD